MKKLITLIILATILLSTSALACSIVCGDSPEPPSYPNIPNILFWIVSLSALFFVFFSNMGTGYNRKYILILIAALFFFFVVMGVGQDWCDVFAACSPEASSLSTTLSNSILLISPLLGLLISIIIRKYYRNVFGRGKQNILFIGVALILIMISLFIFLQAKQELVIIETSSEVLAESYKSVLVNELVNKIEMSIGGMTTLTDVLWMAKDGSIDSKKLKEQTSELSSLTFVCPEDVDVCDPDSGSLNTDGSVLTATEDAAFRARIECNIVTGDMYTCRATIRDKY